MSGLDLAVLERRWKRCGTSSFEAAYDMLLELDWEVTGACYTDPEYPGVDHLGEPGEHNALLIVAEEIGVWSEATDEAVAAIMEVQQEVAIQAACAVLRGYLQEKLQS